MDNSLLKKKLICKGHFFNPNFFNDIFIDVLMILNSYFYNEILQWCRNLLVIIAILAFLTPDGPGDKVLQNQCPKLHTF